MEHIFFEVQLCIKISIFSEFCEFSIFFARLLLGAQSAAPHSLVGLQPSQSVHTLGPYPSPVQDWAPNSNLAKKIENSQNSLKIDILIHNWTSKKYVPLDILNTVYV